MIVCHKKKFIFFKPIKCAGSSIEAVLSQFCDEHDLLTGSSHGDESYLIPSRNNIDPYTGFLRFDAHASPVDFFKRLNTQFPTLSAPFRDYTKVTVVRNPWDLCVSYWWWCISENRPSKNKIPTTIDRDSDIKRKFNLFLPSRALYRIDSNVNEMETIRVIDWLSQQTLKFINLDIDVFLRFENLDEDFSNLCDRLDIESIDLPKLKSSQRKLKMNYKKYYNSAMRDLVDDRFRQMIDKFNYNFEIK